MNAVIVVTADFGPGPFDRFLYRLSPDRNLALMEYFDRFLYWLSPDRNLALMKYEEIRRRITKFFVRKGCHDPDELFAEARERVIKIVNAGGDYPNPEALFYGVARRVWLESTRKVEPEPITIDPQAPTPENKELESNCLGTCLKKLPQAEHDLITTYYQDTGSNKIAARKRLAAAYGGENTLRIKAFRIRAKLRSCMEACMSQAGVN